MKLGPVILPYQPPTPPPAPVAIEEPVLFIHGTFANKAVPTESPTPWWVPGSQFANDLQAALIRHQSTARPIAPDDVFAWTGNNSESDRRAAAKQLAARLSAMDSDPAIRRYHLIAHSHGGNVATRALEEFQPRKLGAVIFLGTPYLSFRDPARKQLKPATVARIIYFLGFTLSLAAIIYLHGGLNSFLQVLAWTSTVTFTICLILSAPKIKPAPPTPPAPKLPFAFDSRVQRDFQESSFIRPLSWLAYGSGMPYAFAFQSDEALNLFRHVDILFKKPRETFDALFSTTSNSSKKLVAPTNIAHEPTLWDEMKDLPHNVLLRYLLQDPQASAKAPYDLRTSPLQPIQTPPMWESLANSIPYYPLFKTLGIAITAVITIPVSMPYLIYAAARELVSVPGRIIAHTVRKLAAWKGPRISANYLRNRAFGIDIGNCTGFEKFPPFVLNYEPISASLEARLTALSQQTGGWAGTIFSNVLTADTDKIRTRFHELFQNPDLVHCRYYQEPEIIDAIATLITANAKPKLSSIFTALTTPKG